MRKAITVKEGRKLIQSSPKFLYAYNLKDGYGVRYVFAGYGASSYRNALIIVKMIEQSVAA